MSINTDRHDLLALARTAACAAAAMLMMAAPVGAAAATQPSQPPPAPAIASDEPIPETQAPEDSEDTVRAERRAEARWRSRGRGHGALVTIGHGAQLDAGERAETVVSILGSSTSAGQVDEAVVSILGSTRVTGPVGDAAVAVLGDVYINSTIGGDAVAVLGSMRLGPKAQIGGDLVVVGGRLERHPAAIVHGEVSRIVAGPMPGFGWLHAWIQNGLMYGRPLALAPGLGWAWTLALGFLALYVLLALMFRGAMDRCVATLETQPGRTTLAALLTVLLTPVAFILITVTIVGAVLVPFLALALFCLALFGKAAVLAVLGRRITGLFGAGLHTAIAVLIGGAIVLALYLVPVVGFIVYKVLGILGLGVAVYTLILASKADRASEAPPSPPPPTGTDRPADPVARASAETNANVNASANANADGNANVNADTSAFAPEEAEKPAAPLHSMPPPAANLSQASLPRASFWMRMGALLIDAVLIGFVLAFWPDVGGAWLLLLATYGAVMWKLKGTTVGGIVLHLQVVRTDGRPIDWATAIVRALGCFLSLAAAGLGFLWIVFDDQKQAWHDKIAGTVVVKPPKGISLV